MDHKAVVDEIIGDLCDRSGLENAWDEIDEDTQDEIRQTWIDIIKKHGIDFAFGTTGY